ncbi:MAG: helix-turn-helix domain-containing protein [Solirubrobacterales bacterium]
MHDQTLPLGLAAAAAVLGVDHSTLRAQVHRGRLRAFKVGRDWLVTDEEIDRYRREVQGGRATKSR